jgi:ATP/maltotriose-dependent transcriptional regulator MalT
VPVAEVRERFDAILRTAWGDQRVAAFVSIVGGCLAAEEGRFGEARDLIARGRAILEELMPGRSGAAPSIYLGQVELFAGDPAAAEAALRPGYEALKRMGEKGFLSTLAAFLAEALCAQGRLAEAEELTAASDAAAGPDDVESQVRWRCVQAKVLGARGERDEAETIVREAVALADETDFLQTRADARVALAEVVGLVGRQDEAVEALTEALKLYEAKGIVVLAARTRTLLEESRPSGLKTEA